MDALGALFAGLGVLVWCVIWLMPILFIAASDRTSGGEKAAWILAVIFVTWFAWIFYLLLAPLKSPSRISRDSYRRSHYRY